MWCSLGVARITQRLVDQLLALRPRPTGLFVLEDRLVPAIEAGLKLHGLRVGPGADFEILSCNSERGHLVMDANQRAGSIDMGIETIGRRGVEHLLWRITHRDVSDRVTILIEPELVESTTA
jgi:DNA-binding LacI/PurR family transcriptional regulator